MSKVRNVDLSSATHYIHGEGQTYRLTNKSPQITGTKMLIITLDLSSKIYINESVNERLNGSARPPFVHAYWRNWAGEPPIFK